MKSKSTLLLILAAVIVVAGLVYFFVIRDDSASPASTESGLVSSNTGSAQGLQNQNAGAADTGSQVVQILRNLSAIQLDDSVFRNPAFAYLSDISIMLPAPTSQGRRNPFAPVGTGTAISATGTTTIETQPAPSMN